MSTEPGKFAFLIHPIEVRRDAARRYPILKVAPVPFIEAIMRRMSPKLTSHITGIESPTGARAEGWLIGVPFSPRQFVSLPVEEVYDKIALAGKMGADLGAKIVGLGAFNSVVGDAGISVAKRLDGIISVTSGNSYTTFTAVEGLLEAARRMDVDVANSRCAIIGATGSTGNVCAKMMAEECAEVVLVGRDEERLAKLRGEVASVKGRATVSVSTDLQSTLPDADLILAVSSATDALIKPEDLKAGAVICDVARPRDVSVRVVRERDDVLVIEGGVVAVPGDVNFNFNFGFPDKTAYACMSETILMALENTYEPFTLGRDLTVENVRRIGTIAAKHGFKLAGFRSFERAVSDEHIAAVRANAHKRAATVVSSPRAAQI